MVCSVEASSSFSNAVDELEMGSVELSRLLFVASSLKFEPNDTFFRKSTHVRSSFNSGCSTLADLSTDWIGSSVDFCGRASFPKPLDSLDDSSEKFEVSDVFCNSGVGFKTISDVAFSFWLDFVCSTDFSTDKTEASGKTFSLSRSAGSSGTLIKGTSGWIWVRAGKGTKIGKGLETDGSLKVK